MKQVPMKKRDNSLQQHDASLQVIRTWCYGAAIFWTILIVGVAGWFSYGDWQEALEIGKQIGWSTLETEQSYRAWGASHGGVYVPITETTLPNPHLAHIPRRDVTTDKGQKLTLVNPSYMIRQVHEQEKEHYGLHGHITSLNPIRPENKPDPWEKKALKQLDQGAVEIHELVEMNGQPYMRVMKPMVTKRVCLECHAQQGYKLGGVGVSVPMQAVLGDFQKEFIRQIGFYLGTLLLVYFGLIVFYRTVSSHFKKRRQAEEELRYSENRFRRLVENAADAIFMFDDRGRFEFVNGQACESLGYTEDELRQLSVADIDVELTERAVVEITSQGSSLQWPITKSGTHQRKDGSTFPVEVRVDRLATKKGLHFVAVARDITERRRTEEQIGHFNHLREELLGLGSLKKKLTRVTEAVVDIFNADFCRIWIIKPGDLCNSGCPHAKLTEGPHVCIHRDQCLHLAASSGRYSGSDSKMHGRVPFGCYKIGRVASGDIPGFNTNDVTHDPRIHDQEWARQLGLVSFTGYRLFSEKGDPIGVLALFSKHVIGPQEVGLLEGVANSTSQVIQVSMAEAEKEIMQTQLLRAQKMKAIGMMAGGVAHDLNNILSGIVSYPELILLQLPKSSELREPLKAIQESGKRAANVVADLLTVARGVAITKEPHDINVLFKEYLDSPECNKLKSLHPGVACTDQLDAERPIIACSPMHIKKTLMNLMTNAAEAVGDEGNVLVSTCNRQVGKSEKLEHDMEPGNYVLFTVQDNGPGIAAKDLEHIFEPFYTKKVMGQSGTGLGLAIVWNTVQDHNGRIFVESSEKGTSFLLYFPLSRQEGVVQAKNNKTEKLTGNSEHILVVDDEPQLRDIASQILRVMGYTVDSVCSGELAIEFIKKNPVDLIVMDMLMEPGMNGCQTYEEIIKLYPDQKAIIASGFSESDDVKAALQLGARGFIKKPYSMDELSRAIKEALNG